MPLFYWSFIFLLAGIVAGLFGFAGLVMPSVLFVKSLFFIFLIVFISWVVGRGFETAGLTKAAKTFKKGHFREIGQYKEENGQ